MAKDMFYYSGLLSGQEHTNGKCAQCPYLSINHNIDSEPRWICTQTEADVSFYNIHDRRNMNCPYITKDV